MILLEIANNGGEMATRAGRDRTAGLLRVGPRPSPRVIAVVPVT
jgi:hypothetical protein